MGTRITGSGGQPIELEWQHPVTGIPEFRVTRGEVEVGRIRVDGPQYWATRAEGDRRPVLFVDRDQAATWLARDAQNGEPLPGP